MGIFLLFQFHGLQSEDNFRFRHISSREGLSDGRVDAVLQDNAGFIWIGTQDGLNRYDAYSMRSYHHNIYDSSSISSNWVRTIYLDRKNRLWIGTEGGGLNRYRPESDNFISYRQNDLSEFSINDNFVRAILQGKDGRLWVGTRAGLMEFDGREEKFFPLEIPGVQGSTVFSENVTALLEDKKGRLWIGTANHIYIYNPVNFSLEHLRSARNEYRITALLQDSRGNIWVGSRYHGISIFNSDFDLLQHYRFSENDQNSISSDEIKDIFEDDFGRIWIASIHGGISIYYPEKNEFQVIRHSEENETGLSSNSVRTIYQDRNSIVWIGLDGSGLDYVDATPSLFSKIPNQPGNPLGLSSKTVLSILTTDGGGIYLGTEGGGINLLTKFGSPALHIEHQPEDTASLPSNQITAMHFSADSTLWIGSKDGLISSDKDFSEFHSYFNQGGSAIGTNFINAMIELDSKLFLATNYDIQCLDMEEKHFVEHDLPIPAKLEGEALTDLCYDRQRNVLYAAYLRSGLLLMDRNTNESLHYISDSKNTNSLSSNFIQDIYLDASGRLWIATRNGLNYLDIEQNKFEVLNRESGLPSNVITALLEDAAGKLWISTTNGLSRYNEKEGVFINYDVDDGLTGNQFWPRSAAALDDSLLLFGGNSGISYFDPSKFERSSDDKRSHLRIINIFINDKAISPVLLAHALDAGTINLKPDQQQVAFEFSSMNFHRPEKVQYASLLEGFNDEWVYSGNRHYVNYTNLDPGAYTFRVKSTGRNGSWINSDSNISFFIETPLYMRWYAFLFYFALLVSLIYYINIYFIGLIRARHDLKLERLEKKRVEELNQAKLQFFTDIAHEFKTPLTLIQAPLDEVVDSLKNNEILQWKSLIMKKNVHYLLRLVRQLLDFRRAEQGKLDLSVRETDVNTFFYELFLLFKAQAASKNIKYDFLSLSEDRIVWIDREKMEEVTINLIDNSFKYSPEDSEISLKLEMVQEYASEEELRISVRDSGPGFSDEQKTHVFERFYLNSTHTDSGSTGIGLSLVKRLVERHHGHISLQSEEGHGSLFTVQIPIDIAAYHEDEISSQVMKDTAEGILASTNYPGEIESKDHDRYIDDDERGQNTILLVEDNSELREFLAVELQKENQVISAGNGMQGLDRALKILPDLIISDIMMPEMDGLQLCKTLKNDIRTSHIPVILLTARSAVEQKVEGIETGADDYIDKPFHLKYLKARITNIIANRDSMRQRYRREFITGPDECQILSADEKILKLIRDDVNDNIDNSEFDVTELARAVGLSRTILFAKLKSLTGYTPNEFIKEIRLEKAAQLLKMTDLSISEIAYKVGFKYQKYFSSSFKKAFNMTASEFRKIK